MMNSGKLRSLLLLACLALAALFHSGCSKQDPATQQQAAETAFRDALRQALELDARGRPGEALTSLEALRTQHPENPLVHEALANIATKLNNHGLAAQGFEDTVRLQPQRVELLIFAALSHEHSSQWEKAIEAYSRYLDSDPENAEARKALARLHSRLNRPRPALEAYIRAVGPSPTALESAEIGRLYDQLGNSEQAEAFYRTALLANDPAARKIALRGLALTDYKKEDWINLDTRLRTLDREFPDLADDAELAQPRARLTSWRAERDKERRAREEAERRAREEMLAEARRQEETRRTQGQNDTPPRQATASPPRATAHDTAPDKLVQQARDLRLAGDVKASIDTAWKAISADSSRHAAWFELSQSYLITKQYINAEATALEAMRGDPTHVNYTLGYLRIIQESQPPERLMQEMINAAQRHPQSPEVILALARGYQWIERNTRNAQIHYNEFLRLAPLSHPERAAVEEALRQLTP